MDRLTAEMAIDASISYDTPDGVRVALRSYWHVCGLARQGNATALCVKIDLERASEVLTPRQRDAVRRCLVDGHGMVEVARALGVRHSAISARIEQGLQKMSRFLMTGTLTAGAPRAEIYSEEDVQR